MKIDSNVSRFDKWMKKIVKSRWYSRHNEMVNAYQIVANHHVKTNKK